MPRPQRWFNFGQTLAEQHRGATSKNGLPFPHSTGPGARRHGRLTALRKFFLSRRLVYVVLFIVAIFTLKVLSSGIPSTYVDVRSFERSMPQQNLTEALRAGTRYLRFSTPVTGRGFNNVLQEALVHSHLALKVNRAFIYEDYIWSHSPLPYTLYEMALRPSRIPLNAFISGPTAGGDIPLPYPRAVNSEFWYTMCPPSERKIVSSIDQPDNLEGSALLDWWVEHLQGLDDRCVEIDSSRKELFDYILFGEKRVLSLWPGLSKSPVYTAFKWSSLVSSALERNLQTIDTSASASQTTSPGDTFTLRGLLAVHLRRGDFSGHCKYLLKRKVEYMGFNRFPEMMDVFDTSNISNPEALKQYYLAHCMPEIDQIVERLHVVRKANPGVNRVYALTNGKGWWMDELKNRLMSDGWIDVKSSLDLKLNMAQEHISMAVDMAIAEKAEVFVGNGFSSLTSNVITLRMVKGLPPSSNRLL